MLLSSINTNTVLPVTAQSLPVGSDSAAASADSKPVPTQLAGAVPAAVSSQKSSNDSGVKGKPQQQQQQKPVDEQTLSKSLDKLNNSSMFNAELEFSVDTASGRQVVKVVDKSSQTVIRQIPSEEAIKMSEALDKATTKPVAGNDGSKPVQVLDNLKGMLVSDKA